MLLSKYIESLQGFLDKNGDIDVATNVGYESCGAEDRIMNNSLIQLQEINVQTDFKPQGVTGNKWLFIGGNGFDED